MNKKIFNYFQIAGKLTASHKDGRSFLLGAIGIRNDGVMVTAINSMSKFPNRQLHAEYKLSKKLDKGSTVYVVRIRLADGQFALARPCVDCFKVLSTKKVRRIFYSISNDEYGVIDI